MGVHRRCGCTSDRTRARRRGAGRPAPWPVARRAGRGQGRHRRRRHDDDGGRGALRPHGADRGRHLRREAAGGGRGDRRQDHDDRARVLRAVTDAQSLQSRPHPGRFVLRLGRRGGRADGPRLARNTDDRLGAAPGRLLRRRRLQGHPRDRPRRWHRPARRAEPRPRRRAGAIGGGRRPRLRVARRRPGRAGRAADAADRGRPRVVRARRAGRRRAHLGGRRAARRRRRDGHGDHAARLLQGDSRRRPGRARRGVRHVPVGVSTANTPTSTARGRAA